MDWKEAAKGWCVLAFVAATATAADASCDFDRAASATSFVSSMVRSYSECPPDAVDTATEGGIEACSPVVPTNEDGFTFTPYTFAELGSRCTLRLNSYKLADCSSSSPSWLNGAGLGLAAVPCQAVRIRLDCRNILDANELRITNADNGFALGMLLRITLNDAPGGDMTTVDYPVTIVAQTFTTPTSFRGRLRIDTSLAAALLPTVGAAYAALPVCTAIHLVDAWIQDPYDLRFAEIGVGTTP